MEVTFCTTYHLLIAFLIVLYCINLPSACSIFENVSPNDVEAIVPRSSLVSDHFLVSSHFLEPIVGYWQYCAHL